MLRLHTKDGKTVMFDLASKVEAEKLLKLLRDPIEQDKITGITVSHRGVQFSLSRPSKFESIKFYAEEVAPDYSRSIKGGQRVTVMADTVRVVMMVHNEQRAVRFSIQHVGKMRFDPILERS